MSCTPCSTTTDLATSIWTDLGSPDDLSVSSIQSKLVSQPYLGKLNNLIVACFSGVSGSICPTLCTDEQGIYSNMYLVDYYTTKLNQTLQGYGTSFTVIREGDSSISRSSVADIARIYRDQQAQLNKELSMQIASYRQNRSMPSSVIYPTIVNDWGAGEATSGPGGFPRGYYRS